MPSTRSEPSQSIHVFPGQSARLQIVQPFLKLPYPLQSYSALLYAAVFRHIEVNEQLRPVVLEFGGSINHFTSLATRPIGAGNFAGIGEGLGKFGLSIAAITVDGVVSAGARGMPGTATGPAVFDGPLLAVACTVSTL